MRPSSPLFKIDRGPGVGAFAHSNQVTAGAEEGNAGLENRHILGMIIAEVAPQLVESFGHRRFELGEAGERLQRHLQSADALRKRITIIPRDVGGESAEASSSDW